MTGQEVDRTIRRVRAMCTRVDGAGAAVPADDVERLLTDGYAVALAGDAWRGRWEARMRATAEQGAPDAAREAALAARDAGRRVAQLRRELAQLAGRRAHARA